MSLKRCRYSKVNITVNSIFSTFSQPRIVCCSAHSSSMIVTLKLRPTSLFLSLPLLGPSSRSPIELPLIHFKSQSPTTNYTKRTKRTPFPEELFRLTESCSILHFSLFSSLLALSSSLVLNVSLSIRGLPSPLPETSSEIPPYKLAGWQACLGLCLQ